MSFNFASLKALARRTVQDTLGVDATYQDDSLDTPEDIRVRFKDKIKREGQLNDQGYAEVLAGIDQIVLIPSDYPHIEFKREGVIVIPEFGLTFILDTKEPVTGPLTELWYVSRP